MLPIWQSQVNRWLLDSDVFELFLVHCSHIPHGKYGIFQSHYWDSFVFFIYDLHNVVNRGSIFSVPFKWPHKKKLRRLKSQKLTNAFRSNGNFTRHKFKKIWPQCHLLIKCWTVNKSGHQKMPDFAQSYSARMILMSVIVPFLKTILEHTEIFIVRVPKW